MTVKIVSVLFIALLFAVPLSHAKSTQTVSLAEASESVRIDTRGKIISAKTTNSNGNQTHKIQVLTPSGRVKTYRVPANSNDSNTRENTRLRRPVPKNSSQQNSADNRRSKYRDRPVHNSRLNPVQQTITSRNRAQTSRSAVRDNTEKK